MRSLLSVDLCARVGRLDKVISPLVDGKLLMVEVHEPVQVAIDAMLDAQQSAIALYNKHEGVFLGALTVDHCLYSLEALGSDRKDMDLSMSFVTNSFDVLDCDSCFRGMREQRCAACVYAREIESVCGSE
jgi:hypothetical protein